MKVRIYRKRGGRSYDYRGVIPNGWVARDEDGKEYTTVEEVDKAYAAIEAKKAKTVKKPTASKKSASKVEE